MLEQYTSANVHHYSYSNLSGTSAMDVLTKEDFTQAVAEISSWEGYQATPLHRLGRLAEELSLGGIYYKDEAPRFGLGSFKALGGAYAGGRVLQRELKRRTGRDVALADIRSGAERDAVADITLVTATDGNHGRSLAWGAQNYGAKCQIYIHREVSEGRAEAMRVYGANVVRVDGDYDQSVRIAREEAEANGWFVVSDTSWDGYVQPPKDVMAGYGVIAHEIGQALPQAPSHVFVQGGVGGLAAAVCAGLRQLWGDQYPRIVVVEPDLADCLYQSAKNGQVTAVNIQEETAMAGLSCGEPSRIAWEILQEEASDFMTIPESLVAQTMRLLGRPLRDDPEIVAGESAIAGLAGLICAALSSELREKLGLNETSRPLVIGTEGATDLEIYNRLMAE